MTMTDRGSRVPLIVKWPNKVKPGTRNDDLIELADFLPTLCEMASAPLPKKSIRGRSFLPQLLGKKGNPKQWVHIEYRENRQIRTKDWIYTNKDKLIKVNEIGEPKNNPEKIGSHKKTREELRNIIEQITRCCYLAFEKDKRREVRPIITGTVSYTSKGILVNQRN